MDILDAAIPDQKNRWTNLRQKWLNREVFTHPDYVSLFTRECDRVVCATLQTESGGILFPFILRPLVEERWAEGNEEGFDIISPYGYGGAFWWNLCESDADKFWIEFEAWCLSHKVVSSFVRLSLFPEQILPFNGVVDSKQANIVRSLTPEPEAIWRDYEHKVRKNVKRANKSQLTFEVDLAGNKLDQFIEIYKLTMDRRNAEKSYFFTRDFFDSIVHKLPNEFAFFHILLDDRIVSTELVLVSTDHIYSFLGGTLPDVFSLRPNDLLKHKIILWARNAGKKAFILGGGYESNDGIFRYKKSFAPQGSMPFCVGTKIHDTNNYSRLIEKRRVWENNHQQLWQPRNGWFPEYRA